MDKSFNLSSNISVSDAVIAVIAGIAAGKIDGIADMSSGVAEGLARKVSGKNVTKGVYVEVVDTKTLVTLKIIVEYGVNIRDVCLRLQQKVKKSIEDLTGLKVEGVNVKGEGVHFISKETKD